MTEAGASWDRIFDINVSAKVITHISSGIYRTPGGILKEFVSNAFDAGANEVTIDTGYPDFDKITICDDGDGMTSRVVDFNFEYVGSSVKVVEPSEVQHASRRPMIGRFGIGLLASAHVTTDIKMTTYPVDAEDGLEVILDLSKYFELEAQVKTLDKFTFGSIRYRHVPRRKEGKGTIVELRNVDKSSNFFHKISKTGLELINWPTPGKRETEPPKIMEEFVDEISRKRIRIIEDLAGRELIAWELGTICPVEYLRDGPVRNEYLHGPSLTVISGLKTELAKLKFKVYYDGIELRKPIVFPTGKLRDSSLDLADKEQSGDIRVFPIEVHTKVPEREDLSAVGYLFFQPNTIIPEELHGLYARQAFVGVGQYDLSFFKTMRSASPIFKSTLSGELYIKSGLDNALNLDRSGFIELDPAYEKLRENIRRLMQGGKDSVVKQVQRLWRARNKRRRDLKEELALPELSARIGYSLKQILPSYQIKMKRIETLAGADVTSYGVIAVDHKNRVVYSDSDLEEPRDAIILLAVDKALFTLKFSQTQRENVAKTIREILSSVGH